MGSSRQMAALRCFAEVALSIGYYLWEERWSVSFLGIATITNGWCVPTAEIIGMLARGQLTREPRQLAGDERTLVQAAERALVTLSRLEPVQHAATADDRSAAFADIERIKYRRSALGYAPVGIT